MSPTTSVFLVKFSFFWLLMFFMCFCTGLVSMQWPTVLQLHSGMVFSIYRIALFVFNTTLPERNIVIMTSVHIFLPNIFSLNCVAYLGLFLADGIQLDLFVFVFQCEVLPVFIFVTIIFDCTSTFSFTYFISRHFVFFFS